MGRENRRLKREKAEAEKAAAEKKGTPVGYPKPSQLSRMLATPIEFEVDGEKWRISPLGLGEVGDLEAWARNKPFDELEQKFEKIKHLQISQDARDSLVIEADKASRDPRVIAAYQDSIEGQLLAFGMMLRLNHPKVKDKKIKKLVSAKGLIQVAQWIDRLNNLTEEEAKNSDTGTEVADPLPG